MPRARRKPQQVSASSDVLDPPGDVLTLHQAAAYLRLPEAAVVHLARTQGLPGRCIGSDWRFLKAAIQPWREHPMSPDNEAFLREIMERPDDDAPRLVYADWLEEHGQPERAEFIRVQVALARELDVYPQRGELKVQEWALLDKHDWQWTSRLRGLVNALEFRRGFVEAVTLQPEAFLEYAETLFRLAPIRRVKFQTAVFALAYPGLDFLSSEWLMPRLAACPHLARLEALEFWRNDLGDRGVAALAASPYLDRLVNLDLSNNNVGDEGITALAASPAFARLAVLRLGFNRIGTAGARALAASPHVTRLTVLDLGENPIGDEGIQALAASPNLSQLTTLGLAGVGVRTVGARALAAAPQLDRLRSLDVRDNIIGNKARLELRLRFGKGNCRF